MIGQNAFSRDEAAPTGGGPRHPRHARAARLHQRAHARKITINEPTQCDLGRPVPARKKFRLCCRANHLYELAPFLPRQEGRLATVTNVGVRNAVDERALPDGRYLVGRRSRVVLAPRRWCQVLESKLLRDDGDKKARSPGRPRRKPLKLSRGECRLISVYLWRLRSCASLNRTRGYGCGRAPGIPCALFSRTRPASL